MATKIFSDYAAVDAAVTSLTSAQLASVSAAPAPHPAAPGSLVLTYPDALASMIGAPMPITVLAARLCAAAKLTADAVTTQIATCETHLTGYTNAVAWTIAAGGAPTVDPGKTAFATMATANGFSASAFASLVLALSASAMTLSAMLTTLYAAAGCSVACRSPFRATLASESAPR